MLLSAYCLLPSAYLLRTRAAHAGFLQTLLNRGPVDIREEGFDVFGTLGRFVVEQIRMFPNVHYQNWIEARDISRLMQRDPVV